MMAERPDKPKKRISEMTPEEFIEEDKNEMIDLREAFTNLGPVAFFEMRAEEYMVLAEDSRNQGKKSLADFYKEWAEKCKESAEKYREMQSANPPKTPENN